MAIMWNVVVAARTTFCNVTLPAEQCTPLPTRQSTMDLVDDRLDVNHPELAHMEREAKVVTKEGPHLGWDSDKIS